jgi:hypothetical protein
MTVVLVISGNFGEYVKWAEDKAESLRQSGQECTIRYPTYELTTKQYAYKNVSAADPNCIYGYDRSTTKVIGIGRFAHHSLFIKKIEQRFKPENIEWLKHE